MKNNDFITRDKPLVSIIITIYQVESYIEKCARSIFEQSYDNIEYLFINDGSTDRSIAILKAVMDNYPVRKAKSQLIGNEHIGIPMAKIRGVEAAKGEYVIFVDADDWVDSNYVGHLVSAALSHSADLVYCDCYKEYSNNKSKIVSEGDFTPADGPSAVKAIYNNDIRGYMCNKLIKRHIYAMDGIIIPPFAYQEDIVLLSQVLLRAKTCVHLKEALYHYRRKRLGSLTAGSFRETRKESAINMLTTYNESDNKNGLLSICGAQMLYRAGWNTIAIGRPGLLFLFPKALLELSRQDLTHNNKIGYTKQYITRLLAKLLLHLKTKKNKANLPYKQFAFFRDSKVFSILKNLRDCFHNDQLTQQLLVSARNDIVSVYNMMFDMDIPEDDSSIIDKILSSIFFQSLPYGLDKDIPPINSEWIASFEDVFWLSRSLANKNRRP